MGELYRLTFPNGKVYIGITSKTAKERFAVHFYQRNRKKHPLYQALAKHPRDAVIVETLAVAEQSELCRMEIEAIASQDCKWPNGFNLTDGGEGTNGLTELSLAKMSATHKGNQYRKGIPFTPDVRAKMSADRKGKCNQSPESRARTAERMRGNKYGLGLKQSALTKARRAASHICGKRSRKNASTFRGVTWDAQTGRWRATISLDGKQTSLGRHYCIGAALNARATAVQKLMGGFEP